MTFHVYIRKKNLILKHARVREWWEKTWSSPNKFFFVFVKKFRFFTMELTWFFGSIYLYFFVDYKLHVSARYKKITEKTTPGSARFINRAQKFIRFFCVIFFAWHAFIFHELNFLIPMTIIIVQKIMHKCLHLNATDIE
jgi:hypothetical protein